ncbi:MAG: SAM-dependent methyltransferase [Clostridia bacterium]|nr:SAM-dependent methyltransferase [Clostridia bacterium]
MEQKQQQIQTILTDTISAGSLKKLILSKPQDKSVLKTTGRLLTIGGETVLQLESFMRDGKALHRNIKAAEAAAEIAAMLPDCYRQLNILTTGGDCEVLSSAKGKITVINRIKSTGEAVAPRSHDRKKHHILDEASRYDFLIELGVEDANGRVIDRKRSKFRQINRFLELLDDVYHELPSEGELCVCDLCCGKSYLTFAVYYYLTSIKARKIRMYGVDLKTDVIEYCAAAAKRLGFDDLHFICGDITLFEPDIPCNLVISLHACDIATDIVLAKAIGMQAKVILSTPCCHHEMMHQIDCPPLAFIEKHSILKQKLCDAATDALRALRLESEGYKVSALELIDPEETPKNVMLRAVRDLGQSGAEKSKALDEYNAACALFGVTPKLAELLKE